MTPRTAAAGDPRDDRGRCSVVPGCALPGRHRFPHEDAKFVFDKQSQITIPVEGSDDETDAASSRDTEIIPDAPAGLSALIEQTARESESTDMGYVFNIEMEGSDWKKLTGKPSLGVGNLAREEVARERQRSQRDCPLKSRRASTGHKRRKFLVSFGMPPSAPCLNMRSR